MFAGNLQKLLGEITAHNYAQYKVLLKMIETYWQFVYTALKFDNSLIWLAAELFPFTITRNYNSNQQGKTY